MSDYEEHITTIRRVSVRCFDLITVEFDEIGAPKPPQRIIDELRTVLYDLNTIKRPKRDYLEQVRVRVAHLRDRSDESQLYMIDMNEDEYDDYFDIIESVSRSVKALIGKK